MNKPVLIAAIGVISGAITGAVTGYVAGRYNVIVERKKIEGQLLIETLGGVKDPKEKIKTLVFLKELELVEDPNDYIALLEKEPSKAPSIPRTVTGTGQPTSYRGRGPLSADEVIRMSPRVGTLEFKLSVMVAHNKKPHEVITKEQAKLMLKHELYTSEIEKQLKEFVESGE